MAGVPTVPPCRGRVGRVVTLGSRGLEEYQLVLFANRKCLIQHLNFILFHEVHHATFYYVGICKKKFYTS